MKGLSGYITICVAALFVCGIPSLGTGGVSAAEYSGMTTHAASIELTAPIMEINLVNDSMVVAEKKIQLLSTVKDGAKMWITVFLDENGNRISFNNFRKRDRVRIKGVRAGFGSINAQEITLLPPKLGGVSSQPVSPPLK